jgi:WD40 repeat protein
MTTPRTSKSGTCPPTGVAVTIRRPTSGDNWGISGIAFSPDSRLLAVDDPDGQSRVDLWNAATGKSAGVLSAPDPHPIEGLAFSRTAW